jgi:hypothetical protein
MIYSYNPNWFQGADSTKMSPREIFDELYGEDSGYNPYNPNYRWGENYDSSTTTTTTTLGWGMMTTTGTIPQTMGYAAGDDKFLTSIYSERHTFMLMGQPIIIELKGHAGITPCYIGGAGVGGHLCYTLDFRHVEGSIDFAVASVSVEYDDGDVDVSVDVGPNVDVGEGLQGGRFDLSGGMYVGYTEGEYWYNFTFGSKGEAGAIGTTFPASGSGGIEIKLPFTEVDVNPSGGELKITIYPKAMPWLMPVNLFLEGSYSYTFNF